MTSVARRHPTEARVVAANAYIVRSNWGRTTTLGVYLCADCGERHVVTAPVDADSVRRRTACKLSTVLVVFGIVRSEPPR